MYDGVVCLFVYLFVLLHNPLRKKNIKTWVPFLFYLEYVNACLICINDKQKSNVKLHKF